MVIEALMVSKKGLLRGRLVYRDWAAGIRLRLTEKLDVPNAQEDNSYE